VLELKHSQQNCAYCMLDGFELFGILGTKNLQLFLKPCCRESIRRLDERLLSAPFALNRVDLLAHFDSPLYCFANCSGHLLIVKLDGLVPSRNTSDIHR